MAETPTQGSQGSALQGVEYQGGDFASLLNTLAAAKKPEGTA